MKLNSYRTLKTKCGKEFDKDLLKVIAFTTNNVKYSHITYTIYKTQLDGYIRCFHKYDAVTDSTSVNCEFISEQEAMAYITKPVAY